MSEELKNEEPVTQEEMKTVVNYLQWKFSKQFETPPPKSIPKREHLFAFFNFYDDTLRDSTNNFEKIICVNQKKNIMNMANHIHKISEKDFIELYILWSQCKSFPAWD